MMEDRSIIHSDPLDVEAIKADFPIFEQLVHGHRLTFLDSAASAQKPNCVIDAEVNLYKTTYANIHRGVYKFSQDATQLYEDTRTYVRDFINAKSHREIIFVRGATEGINLVANSWGRQNIKAGDEIILTWLEHHSNIVPWQMLAEATGAVIKVVPIDDAGVVDMDAYRNLLSERTKIVAVAHVSNSIGTIVPVKQMIEMAHEAGALTLIDGCQAIPHMAVDMQALDADFYVFSGHKTFGPTGIGVLYGKEALLDAMPPWQGGGDMISSVTFEKTTYNDLPYKFEAGTPNIAGGIALKPALTYIKDIGYDRIMAHEAGLLAYCEEQLKGFNGLKVIGKATNRAAVVSFVMDVAHPHDIGTILDRRGIAVRAGHHCAQPVMERFNVPGTVRASFSIYNDRSDVDRLVEGLKKVVDLFG
jgi:cysteine desulfurase / selenocysteine lyase